MWQFDKISKLIKSKVLPNRADTFLYAVILLLFPADIYNSAICGYKDLLWACGISSVNVYSKRPSFDSVSLGDF